MHGYFDHAFLRFVSCIILDYAPLDKLGVLSDKTVWKMSDSKEKQIVIKAVNDLGRRLSTADLSAKTGLAVAIASLNLNQIAAETGGHLQVSNKGDIVYQFPPGYQAVYITRGLQRLIEKAAQKIFSLAFFLLRISFGIMLILSLLIIALTFFVILLAGQRNRDDDSFSVDLNFIDWYLVQDLLFWNTDSLFRWGDQGISSSKRNKQNKSNFLYDCFSFLFGDGNPNANIEEKRWQSIAQLIRENNCAVTAEQLSPYTGANPNNEDNVLPILVRFDGHPMVTDSGNIVYLFPALNKEASPSRPVKDGTNSLLGNNRTIPFLTETKWQFSADNDSMIWILVLAGLNLLGSWWLYLHLASISTFHRYCLFFSFLLYMPHYLS